MEETKTDVQQVLRLLGKTIERKNIEIEKFAGGANQDFNRWIEEFNFRTGGENEETKLSLLKIYLIGDARKVFEGLSKDESCTYGKSIEALRKFFHKNATTDLIDTLELEFRNWSRRFTQAMWIR